MSKRWNEDDLERLKKRGFKVIETTKTGKKPELSEYSLDVSKRGRPNMSNPDNVANPIKKNKFNAKKVLIDGITFDSTKEGRRYQDLKLLQSQGEINNLELQVKYSFVYNFITIGTYRADFVYFTKDGTMIVEDVKSPITRKKADYRLRRRMMAAFFGIDILET